MTKQPLVAITRRDLPGDPAARLSAVARVRVWGGAEAPTADELSSLLGGCTAVLCVNGDPISAELLDRLPELRLVSIGSTGYDMVDVAAAAERGIAVSNTPGVLSESVADMSIGLMLAARRRIVEADRYVRRGDWTTNNPDLKFGEDLHDATLGLVGFGAIGRAVAARAAGFRMRVVYHDPTPAPSTSNGDAEPVDLDELLRIADVISLHVPLTPETRQLIGERELRAMKPTATLINTSRGGVIDQAALVRALSEGWIGSAGLDVQETEPNPDTADPLLLLPNCVVLPHIASATRSAREAMIARAAENIEAYLAGGLLLTPVRGSAAPRPLPRRSRTEQPSGERAALPLRMRDQAAPSDGRCR